MRQDLVRIALSQVSNDGSAERLPCGDGVEPPYSTNRRNDMRKLVVQTFMSLDGVMQAPGGPDEDRDGGFEHGGWAVPHFDEQMMQFIAESTGRAGALLL